MRPRTAAIVLLLGLGSSAAGCDFGVGDISNVGLGFGGGGSGGTLNIVGGAGGAAAGAAGASPGLGGTASGTAGAGGSAASGGQACAPQPRPSYVPPDWAEVPFSCSCTLFSQGKGAAPKPRKWGPCVPVALASACEQLQATAGAAVFFKLQGQSNGSDILYVQENPQFPVHLLLAPDGKVLDTVAVAGSTCTTSMQSVSEQRFLLRVDSLTPQDVLGVVGGIVGEGLTYKRVGVPNMPEPNWFASADWIFRGSSAIFAAPWTDGGAEIPLAVPSNGLPLLSVDGFAKGAVVQGVANGLTGIYAWAPSTGALPIYEWPGDKSRGALHLGMDGQDMAWDYGEGVQTSAYVWPKRTLMTAKASLVPKDIVATAKSVRSLPTQNYPSSWKVKCGRAAKYLGDGQLLVVRLSDGWSWPIVTSGPMEVGALTCEHLYLQSGQAILRFTLAELGAGEPGPPPLGVGAGRHAEGARRPTQRWYGTARCVRAARRPRRRGAPILGGRAPESPVACPPRAALPNTTSPALARKSPTRATQRRRGARGGTATLRGAGPAPVAARAGTAAPVAAPPSRSWGRQPPQRRGRWDTHEVLWRALGRRCWPPDSR